MADEILIVPLEDPDRWDREHRDGGLPSQSWRYAHALSASGIAAQLAVVTRGGSRMLLPFFERRWRDRTDIATTIGLSGASISPPSPAPLEAWRAYGVGRGWVAGYVQLSPYGGLQALRADDRVVEHNAVFSLDLRTDPMRSASQIVRRKIQRASKAGVDLVDDRDELAAAVERLYPRAVERTGAGPLYAFSPETLGRWVTDPNSIVLGARAGEAIKAMSIFCVADGHAEYHLNASSTEGREFTAWLIAKAIEQLRACGVETLNLGGGARPNDGVYYFKERFGGVRLPLRAVHQIYDPGAYEELCREAGAAPDGLWFPAYRAPR